MIKSLAILLCLLATVPALAQEQDATDTPEEKLKKMRAAGLGLPKDVITSFRRRTVDNKDLPWRAVGRVNVGGRKHCSGTLVTENIVLTAAHCLYSKPAQTLVVPTTVHFLAGYSKGDYRAHSRVKSYIVPDGFDGAQGESQENLRFDWALLTLEDAIGAKLGFVPLHENLRPGKPLPTSTLLSTPDITTAGYPGDRAHILSLVEGCQIRNSLYRGHVMLTDCVAIGGDSGGPILQQSDDGPVIIGVLTAATKVGRTHASIGVSALAFRHMLPVTK